ncbi:TolC family protein [Desulfonema ishimotonii]|uniref:TolC family protein n=1 Tax=Desulfonema ishimotonii TaxID=45657 RepID=A0A401G150_9BACT|nr:TolC family protein [Desulfonema ishimotonii]GBC62944.1 TolC family protein [Desulfonema ishimotonii]
MTTTIQYILLIFLLSLAAPATPAAETPREGAGKIIRLNEIEVLDPEAAQTDAEESLSGILNEIKILDLKTARQIALSANPSLAAARDRVVQASERVMQARSAYFPKIDAGASGARIWRSDTQLAALGDPDDPEDTFTADLKATWTLFDGFARKFRNLSARYGEQESREADTDARRLLLAAVAAGYYNGQLAREDIAIAKADETFNMRQAHEAKAREAAGTGSLSDVLNFKVQVNSARTRLLLAQQEYEAAMIGLAGLLGIPDSRFPGHITLAELSDETPEEMTLPDTENLIRYARTHRPDVRQDEYALRRAASDVGEARSGFYPTVRLAGSVDGERTDNMGFDGDDIGGALTMTFDFNLFEGGYTRARVREALARKSETQNTLKDTRIAVTAQVRDAAEVLKLARDQLVLQRASVKLVRQNRDLVEKEYQAGQASLVRLNEAQRDLTQTRSRLVLALVSLRRAWENLRAATGEILTDVENISERKS